MRFSEVVKKRHTIVRTIAKPAFVHRSSLAWAIFLLGTFPLVAQDTSILRELRRGALRLQYVLLFPKLTKQQEKMLLEQKLKQMNQEQPQKN